MRTLILLFAVFSSLFSLEIIINSAKENNQKFEILHIKNSSPFKCYKVKETLYECKIYVKTNFKEKIEKSSFFHIYISNENNITTIVIKPKLNSILFPISSSLYKNKIITPPKKGIPSTHWQIVGFKNKIEYLQQNENIGINFPITYKELKTPYIGALDIKQKPITYDQKKEITPYQKLLQYFKKKEYEDLIKEADYLLKKDKNIIFKSEIMLLKIRALDKFLESEEYKKSDLKITYNDLEESAKRWLKLFPSDRHIPEIMMFLSKAYLHTGMKKNALYYLNILTTEYKNSRFTELGKIYLIDTYAENKPKKALKEYKKILFSTKDIFVASTAADRIANIYLKIKNIQKAKEYFKKILISNPNFYLKNQDEAYNLAHKFAANSLEEIGAIIADKIIKNTTSKKKRDPFFEELLKDRAYWFDKAGEKEKAYKYYKDYLKKYPYGNYADFVKKRLDLLIFDIPDRNVTKTLKQYDDIIKKYKDDKEVKEKALLEKAKLLLKTKKYQEVLKMRSSLKTIKNKDKEINLILKKAAYQKAVNDIKQKKCIEAINLIKEYNLKIKENDFQLFNCYIKTADYKNALKIFKRHKREENLKNKAKWLYMGAKLFYKIGDYKKVLEICEDLKKIDKLIKIDTKDMLYLCFNAMSKENLYKQMINLSQKLEKNYPNNFKNIDIFYKIVKEALSRKDDLVVLKFARKIINLQNSFKIYTLTPNIEFIYIEALKRVGKNKEALKEAKKVLKKIKTTAKKARALFLAGELSVKNNDIVNAKKFFRECMELNTSSPWKNLCKENLSLY